MLRLLLLVVLMLAPFPLVAGAVDAERLVAEMDALMRGTTSAGTYSMTISTNRWSRTVKMESWSEGSDKSFILITYPPRDRGITFLKLGNEMWQFVPKIEKTIKIPPSLMLQSWMGSDLTNDDMVRESSMVHDYDKQLLSETNGTAVIQMTPRPHAAVVWGKVLLTVDFEKKMPIEVTYYDEDNVAVRTMFYRNMTRLKDRWFPLEWEVRPLLPEKQGNKTVVTVSDVTFDTPLDPNLFTIRSLKRKVR